MDAVKSNMTENFEKYRKDGILALRHMWFVIAVFSLVQVIVSIAIAAANSNDPGGYTAISFAAIWAMFLVIAFGIIGGRIVFGGKAPELMVGFLIGVASMLAQLFFVLAIICLGVGTEATLNKHNTASADKAYGAFGLINTIIYGVWAIILSANRKAVISDEKEKVVNNDIEKGVSSESTHNPVSQEEHDDNDETL